jgi:hypothetical protein
MPIPSGTAERVWLVAAVLLALAALALTRLSPGFSLHNTLVYGRF